MTCMKCQGQMDEGATVCPACRARVATVMPPPPPVDVTVVPREAPDRRLALTSLVLGMLVGTAPVGLVLGLRALGHARQQGQHFGLALAGVGVSAFMTVLGLPLLAMILFSATFIGPGHERKPTSCINQQRQIATALQMYAQDYNEGVYPPADTHWDQALLNYIGSPKCLVCPEVEQYDPDVRLDYGMNQHLLGQPAAAVTDPANVLAFADSSQRLLKTTADIDRNHHGRNGAVVSYVDGHAVRLRPTDTLSPTAIQPLSTGGK